MPQDECGTVIQESGCRPEFSLQVLCRNHPIVILTAVMQSWLNYRPLFLTEAYITSHEIKHMRKMLRCPIRLAAHPLQAMLIFLRSSTHHASHYIPPSDPIRYPLAFQTRSAVGQVTTTAHTDMWRVARSADRVPLSRRASE